MADSKFQFHYTPTGTGVISGPEVLQQTEDAINDVGAYADQASDNSEEALSIAKEARQTAQTANSTSSNALAEANAANEKVETLKQVVDDWDADIQTAIAQSKSAVDASTVAVTTANSAQTSASAAQTAAQGSAASAQTAANNAAQSLQTAQAAQQAAETAQSNAETAQTAAQTAETKALEAAASAYAVRVINQALQVSATIQISDLKPQGNIKAGDTVVGTDGRMFTIASVDSAAGTALLSADYTDLTPSVSYEAAQALTETQQTTARSNINFTAGAESWAETYFNGHVDDYLCPILEELILENGGTQQEIDDAKNSAETETPSTN